MAQSPKRKRDDDRDDLSLAYLTCREVIPRLSAKQQRDLRGLLHDISVDRAIIRTKVVNAALVECVTGALAGSDWADIEFDPDDVIVSYGRAEFKWQEFTFIVDQGTSVSVTYGGAEDRFEGRRPDYHNRMSFEFEHMADDTTVVRLCPEFTNIGIDLLVSDEQLLAALRKYRYAAEIAQLVGFPVSEFLWRQQNAPVPLM